MKRILIAGAGGQIGSELTAHLRKIYGPENVIAADLRDCPQLAYDGPFEILNIYEVESICRFYLSCIDIFRVD